MDDLLAELLAARPDWHRDALCVEFPSVNFFVERGEDCRPAKSVCARCLVRAECLAAGLEDRHGIWGGTSWRERRRLRVERGDLVVGRAVDAA